MITTTATLAPCTRCTLVTNQLRHGRPTCAFCVRRIEIECRVVGFMSTDPKRVYHEVNVDMPFDGAESLEAFNDAAETLAWKHSGQVVFRAIDALRRTCYLTVRSTLDRDAVHAALGLVVA